MLRTNRFWKDRNTHKSFFRGIALGVIVSLITSLLSLAGFLQRWENGFFDFLVWWEKEKRSTEVMIVEIDDADYKNLFGAQSPLSRKKMSEIIVKLAESRPRVIGIDINLEDITAEDEYMIEAFQHLNQLKVPIVLPAYFSEDAEGTESISSAVKMYPYPLPDLVLFGAIGYPMSRDGVIREMPIVHKTRIKNIYPFFPLSVLAACEGFTRENFAKWLNSNEVGKARGSAPDKKLVAISESAAHSPIQKIHFIGNKSSFSTVKSSTLLQIPRQFFESENIFSDKIIVIGGTFKESRDFYATPKGMMSGVEIIANSIETLLSIRPLRPINHILEFSMEIIIILLLSVFFLRFSPWKGTLISIATIIPLAVVGSYVAFSAFSRWLNFIPAGFSIILHGQVAFYTHYRELQNEVKALKDALRKSQKNLRLKDSGALSQRPSAKKRKENR
jgi:CHASE2 domain-containing sensor protein